MAKYGLPGLGALLWVGLIVSVLCVFGAIALLVWAGWYLIRVLT